MRWRPGSTCLRRLWPNISFVEKLAFQKTPELGVVNAGTILGVPRILVESRLGGNRAKLLDNAAPRRLSQNGLEDGFLESIIVRRGKHTEIVLLREVVPRHV